MLITVIARVGITSCYAANIFEIQILKMFFNQQWARNKLYQYCITISMQFLGYGLAGLARACIVFPDFCLWPANLATIVLNRSLHEQSSTTGFRIGPLVFSRFRWLIFLCGAYTAYHMLFPSVLSHFLELALASYFRALWKTSIGSLGLIHKVRLWHLYLAGQTVWV
jgi:hypothetical protein